MPPLHPFVPHQQMLTLCLHVPKLTSRHHPSPLTLRPVCDSIHSEPFGQPHHVNLADIHRHTAAPVMTIMAGPECQWCNQPVSYDVCVSCLQVSFYDANVIIQIASNVAKCRPACPCSNPCSNSYANLRRIYSAIIQLDAFHAPLEVNVNSLSTLVISPSTMAEIQGPVDLFLEGLQPLFSPYTAAYRSAWTGLMRPETWEQEIVACCEFVPKEDDLIQPVPNVHAGAHQLAFLQ